MSFKSLFFIFICAKILSSCIFIFFTIIFGRKKLGIKVHLSLKLDIIGLVGEFEKSIGLIVNLKNNQYKILVSDLEKSTRFVCEFG